MDITIPDPPSNLDDVITLFTVGGVDCLKPAIVKLEAILKAEPGAFTGRKHTAASIEKMRRASRGRTGYWRGKKRAPETIRAMREAMIGRPGYWTGKSRSQETKARISATKTGVPRNMTPRGVVACAENIKAATEALRRPVICLTTGEAFASIVEAAAKYALKSSSVAHVCRGDRNSVHGYRFAYGERS